MQRGRGPKERSLLDFQMAFSEEGIENVPRAVSRILFCRFCFSCSRAFANWTAEDHGPSSRAEEPPAWTPSAAAVPVVLVFPVSAPASQVAK